MASELEGVRKLTAKLNKLDGATQVKVLRSVLFKATTPTVRLMKARVPVSNRASRTYKGRLVGPGFARRSIRRITGRKFLSKGLLSVAIGVRAEAFYAINFIDQGPHTITDRRVSSGRRSSTSRNIRPYILRRQPWFESSFLANQSRMLTDIKTNLKKKMEVIARG